MNRKLKHTYFFERWYCTGSIGKGILAAAINNKSCEKILSITRKEPPFNHPKVNVVLWKDFMEKLSSPKTNKPDDEVINLFQGYDICVNAVGISSAKVTQKQYEVIQGKIPVALGNLVAHVGIPYFYHVSLGEASYKVMRYFHYAQTCYETEEFLKKIKFKGGVGFIKPPGVIDPDRWLLNYFSRFFRFFVKRSGIEQIELGNAVLCHFENYFNKDKSFGQFDFWPGDLMRWNEKYEDSLEKEKV